MKNILLLIALFIFVISCSKEKQDECEIFEEQLLGDYCTISSDNYSYSYSVDKIDSDTFLLFNSDYSLKFATNNNSIIIPRQHIDYPVEWGNANPNVYESRIYFGEGHLDCISGLIELQLTYETNDTIYSFVQTLMKSENFAFEGTYKSKYDDITVTLNKDSNSDSLNIHVEMDYLDERDSLLINLKAAAIGCSYQTVFEISDSTKLYGYVFYKENELLLEVALCPQYSSNDECDFSNGITLNNWVNCCEDIVIFEGTKVE